MDSNLTDIGFTKESTYGLAATSGVRASGVFILTGQPANAETVTIDGKVYTYKTVLTAANGDVFIGATLQASALNLIAAITLAAGGSGVQYGSGTTLHPTVTAVTGGSGQVNVTAKANGTGGNAIATIKTLANGSWTSGATLSGGTANAYATKTKFRFKSESLKHAKETVSDESIRSDRMVDEQIQVGVGAGGAIETEFYLGDEIWTLQQSAMMAAEQTVDFVTVTAVLSVATQTITQITNPIAQGARLIRLLNCANGANNGLKTVISQSGNTLTLAPGSIVTNETTSGIIVRCRYVRTGTLVESYMIEKFGVTLATYMQYLGMMIDSYGLTMEAKKKMTQTFGWLGYGGQRKIDSGMSAATGAGTGSVLTGSNNIGFLLVNGITPVSSIKKIDMGVKNNLRARGALGKLGTILPGAGSSDVAGSIDTYFDDTTNLDLFLNHSNASIQVSVQDKQFTPAGLGFFFPNVSFPDGNWNIGGLNQDIMIPLQFKAQRDLTLGYQMQIDYPQPTT